MMFMRAIVVATAFVSILSITGCATSGTQHIEAYGARLAQSRTVTSFSELPYKALPLDDAVTVLLGAESKDATAPLTIKSGNDEASFVALFRLPDWQGAYSIQVTSFMFGGTSDPAIFYPRFVLLDKNFALTRQSVAKDFVYRGTGAQGGVAATVFLNEENRDEAYLAVLSEPRRTVLEQTSLAQTAGSSPLIVPIRGGALMWLIPMGGQEHPKPMRAAAGGQVLIKASLYKPKRIEASETPVRRP